MAGDNKDKLASDMRGDAWGSLFASAGPVVAVVLGVVVIVEDATSTTTVGRRAGEEGRAEEGVIEMVGNDVGVAGDTAVAVVVATCLSGTVDCTGGPINQYELEVLFESSKTCHNRGRPPYSGHAPAPGLSSDASISASSLVEPPSLRISPRRETACVSDGVLSVFFDDVEVDVVWWDLCERKQ